MDRAAKKSASACSLIAQFLPTRALDRIIVLGRQNKTETNSKPRSSFVAPPALLRLRSQSFSATIREGDRMLTVHHLNNSRSQRIVWLCEELDLDYKLVKHQRNPKTHRSPDSLNAIHPLGKAPTIEHDGKLIAETDAVI